MDFEKLGIEAHNLYKEYSYDYRKGLRLVDSSMPRNLERGYRLGYENLMSYKAIEKIFENSKDGRVVIPFMEEESLTPERIIEELETITDISISIEEVLSNYVKEKEEEKLEVKVLTAILSDYHEKTLEIEKSLVNGVMNVSPLSFSIATINSDGGIDAEYIKREYSFFRNGMKFNKALKNSENKFGISFEGIREEIEEVQTKISKIKQSSYTKNRELVLSINPLDFVTMSFNNRNWNSCTDISSGTYSFSTYGSYRSGRVIMAYLRDGEKIEGYDADDKIWRALVFVDENSFIISKHYPYYSVELEKAITSYLDRYYSKYVSSDYVSIPWSDANYIDAFYNDFCEEDFGNYYLKNNEEAPNLLEYESLYYIDPVTDHFSYETPEDLSLSIFSDNVIGNVYYCDFCGEMLIEDLDEVYYNEDGDYITETFCEDCHGA